MKAHTSGTAAPREEVRQQEEAAPTTTIRCAIIPAMSEEKPPPVPVRPITPIKLATAADDKVACERCGAEMYRMHAVWRCSECGYKTDCCGW
jgi:tRNA(Ile2) C34 agmatinyltransferase TiaS